MLRVCLALLFLFGIEWGEAKAFKIITPAPQTVLQSGQNIIVAIDRQAEAALGRVRYYWYRFDEEPLAAQLAEPALAATESALLPYGGTLRVPFDAIGAMRLLAVGEIVSGRLAGHEEFDEIIVDVDPQIDLTRIEFETEKPLKLDTRWKIIPVPAIGLFADGIARRIYGKGTGSTYRSTDERVITVSSEGSLRVMGDGAASILVRNRGQEGSLEVVVRTDGESNRPPTADAGPDQSVKGESKVTLNGLRSTDPDGDPLRYEWKQIRGNKISLLDADTPKATFIAPKVSARRLFRFSLQVMDLKGPDTIKGADSVPSYTDVWVEP